MMPRHAWHTCLIKKIHSLAMSGMEGIHHKLYMCNRFKNKLIDFKIKKICIQMF